MAVEIEGRKLEGGLRGKQGRALLAYLVLNRERPVGRDELIDAIWPGKPPADADASLRTLLSRLRSALGRERLEGRAELNLVLPVETWVDIEYAEDAIERAEAALSRDDLKEAWGDAQVALNVARRSFLAGADARWIEERRRELDELKFRALECLARASVRLGGSELATAERAARELIEAAPYREGGHVLLMRVLAERGSTAEALRAYEELRVRLRDELGTAPGAEAQGLHQRLLGAGAGPLAETGAGAVHVPLPPALTGARALGFVGREDEMALLRRHWEGAPGAEKIVLVSGEPGIGKSRLAQEFARLAGDGSAIVLYGRSDEQTLVAYQPFVEALRHWAVNAPLDELRDRVELSGAEIARLIPDIRRRLPELPDPPRVEPSTDRFRLFEAISSLLAELADSAPLLLLLDDLHWADTPSLLLLRHISRSPALERPILILGTYRQTELEAEHPLAKALADLRREGLFARLALKGFEEPDVGTLIEAWGGSQPPAGLVHAVYEETDGNPFFVVELMRHLSESDLIDTETGRWTTALPIAEVGIPEGIKEVISRRMARLTGSAEAALNAAAAFGGAFALDELQRVSGLAEAEVVATLEQAIEAGIVAPAPEAGGRYRFSHALIRETLYSGLSAPRRTKLHREIGEALEELHRDDDRFLPELAHHFLRAASRGDAKQAILYATKAGHRATAELAYEEAAAHFERALEAVELEGAADDEQRCELLLSLGQAHQRAGDTPGARGAFEEAALLARNLGDAELFARAALGIARRFMVEAGAVDEPLVALLEEALERYPDEDSLTRVRLLTRLTGAVYYSDQRDRMTAVSGEAMAMAERLADPDALAYAHSARRRALWSPEELDQRLAASKKLVEAARAAGDNELILQGHGWLVVDLLEHGDVSGVKREVDAFEAIAKDLRQALYLWNVALWRAMLALLEGRLDEAEQLAQEALAVGQRAESGPAAQYFATQLFSLRRDQGRLEELEDAARQFIERYPAVPAWRCSLAAIYAEDGRHDEAREQLEELASEGFELPRDAQWLIAMNLLAETCAVLDDAERAEIVYPLLEPYAGRAVVVAFAAACYGPASRVLGLLAATMGRFEEGERYFEEALEMSGQMGARPALARTQRDYAGMLRKRGREGDEQRAAQLLDDAAGVAEELGMAGLVEAARA